MGEELSNRMLAHFKKHGIGAIERVYRENPVEYLRVCTRLIPQEIEAEVQHTFTDILARAHERVLADADVDVIKDTDVDTGEPKSLILKEKQSIDTAITGELDTRDSSLEDTS